MIPTIENPGPFDALSKARPGEPFFQLLGRDLAAPGAITEWCRQRRNHAIKTLSGDALAEELRQCADAEAIALAMGDYRAGISDETADAGTRVTHGGAMGESQEQRDRNRLVAETLDHLRNAAAHVNDACEGLARLGIDALAIHKASNKPGLPVFDLADALTAIKDADAAIAPKRGVAVIAEAPEPIQPSFEAECQHEWVNQADDGAYGFLIDKCAKCGSVMA